MLFSMFVSKGSASQWNCVELQVFAHWAYVSNNFPNLDPLPPEAYYFHDDAAISNAHCIAFAIWTPTEPAANLPLYDAYLLSTESLSEGTVHLFVLL